MNNALSLLLTSDSSQFTFRITSYSIFELKKRLNKKDVTSMFLQRFPSISDISVDFRAKLSMHKQYAVLVK